MAVNAQEMLQRGCCDKWCAEIETELNNLKNLKREQMNLYNKKKSIRDKSLDEQIAPKMQLEALKKQKAAIEMIRQEDRKRLARYLKVAQRHYLQQRDEIVAQMEQSVSGEEKMKLFLLLALTEQDFENLRRTSDGHKSKTIDNKTRGEVGALFQGYVVQPLTEELQTKLEKAASDENDQLEAVKEELGTVKRAVIRTDSSVGKTAKEDTLKASKEEIMDELETLQNGVTAARNTITKQMQTDNEAAAQANQTLLQEMEKTQQEIETAKKIIQGELRRQGENSYETIEEGFAGTEKKMDDNFRQFGEKLEKQDEA